MSTPWIPTSEKLPEFGEYVLVWPYDEPAAPQVARRCMVRGRAGPFNAPEGHYWWTARRENDLPGVAVSHWAPITPPGEVVE